MKIDGHGQAKVLSPDELKKLFTEGFLTPRDLALFGICFYTGCRISETLALRVEDIQGNLITLRKGTTKGKQNTRQIDLHSALAQLLDAYNSPQSGPLFPGKRGVTEQLTRSAAHKLLKEACDRVGLVGVSTHSFRRTALTQMSAAGVPLRAIQEVSGHLSLSELQKYLEVSPDQRRAAVMVVGF